MNKVKIENLDMALAILVYPLLAVLTIDGYISLKACFVAIGIVVVTQILYEKAPFNG